MLENLWSFGSRVSSWYYGYALITCMAYCVNHGAADPAKAHIDINNTFDVIRLHVDIAMSKNQTSNSFQNLWYSLCNSLREVTKHKDPILFRGWCGCQLSVSKTGNTESLIGLSLYFAKSWSSSQEDCVKTVFSQRFLDWFREADDSLREVDIKNRIIVDGITAVAMDVGIRMDNIPASWTDEVPADMTTDIINYMFANRSFSNYLIDAKIYRQSSPVTGPHLVAKLYVDSRVPEESLRYSVNPMHIMRPSSQGDLSFSVVGKTQISGKHRTPKEELVMPFSPECQNVTRAHLFEVRTTGIIRKNLMESLQKAEQRTTRTVERTWKQSNSSLKPMVIESKHIGGDSIVGFVLQISTYFNTAVSSKKDQLHKALSVKDALCKSTRNEITVFPEGCVILAGVKHCVIYDPPMPVIFVKLQGVISYKGNDIRWEDISDSNQKTYKDAREACEIMVSKMVQNTNLTEICVSSTFEGFTNDFHYAKARFLLSFSYVKLETTIYASRDGNVKLEEILSDQEIDHAEFKFTVESSDLTNGFLPVKCREPEDFDNYVTIQEIPEGSDLLNQIPWTHPVKTFHLVSEDFTQRIHQSGWIFVFILAYLVFI